MLQIINGDCNIELKGLPEKCVDLVLTDPPYNISRETNFHKGFRNNRGTTMDFGDWDKDADIVSFISLLPKLLKKGANVVIFNAWENLGKIAKAMEDNNITPKRALVLNKTNPAPFNRDRLFVNDVEFAVWGVFKNADWTFNRKDDFEKCVFTTTVQQREYHPTMKDLDVMKKLILILSNKGDMVLDPFMGSGTTLLAAKELNRNAIGIDIDKEYCIIAKERTYQEVIQW